jgi:predicted anti-sigma-YlaC factor YlaD
MNCKACQEIVSKYQKEVIPAEEKSLIKAHLDSCETCQKFFAASKLMNQFVANEKKVQVNPFLATRVMAQIENMEQKKTGKVLVTARVQKLQPFLLAASVIFAVFLGIQAGNLYHPVQASNQTPEELMYLNDAAMESLSVFMND